MPLSDTILLHLLIYYCRFSKSTFSNCLSVFPRRSTDKTIAENRESNFHLSAVGSAGGETSP